ncbi:MAG TPA: aspartyl protease family protein [Candidatus Sulfotelmatobacter sp.]
MRFAAASFALFLLCTFGFAQTNPTSLLEPKSVTIPAVIDHNRVIIDVQVPLHDGSMQTVHAWVDNGNPDLYMSEHIADLVGGYSCDGQKCFASPPREVVIGGMEISFAAVKQARVPLRSHGTESVMAAGMSVEINLPSSILRHYDVLIDFPGHKFSIGAPGTIHFRGQNCKALINAENGLIQVPSQIEKKKYTLALDLGAGVSFLSDDLFDKLAAAHADWPHMTGTVGSANIWGADDETKWKLMRLDRVQFGPLFLTGVPVVAMPTTYIDFLEKPAGASDAGLLGSNALLNYRIGLDYAHSTVYFEFGRMFSFPEFDVIGLTLRPEDDGRFTILGAPEYEGQPSVPQEPDGVQAGDHLIAVDGIPVGGSTLGQVWNTLGGTPGQERKLTIERGAKQFVVAARVQHFLAELPEKEKKKKK